MARCVANLWERVCLYISTECRFSDLDLRKIHHVTFPKDQVHGAHWLAPPPPASSRLRAASSAPHPPRCTPRPTAKKSVWRVRAREESAPMECHPDQQAAAPAARGKCPKPKRQQLAQVREPCPSARHRCCGPQPALRVLPPAAGDTAPLGRCLQLRPGSSCLNPQYNVCSFVVLL